MSAIIPATPAHIAALYGHTLGRTVRALAVVDGERVLGVGGIYHDDGRTVIFSKKTDDLRRQKRILILASRQIMGWLREEAFALCDTSIPKARDFLEHMGFEQVQGEVYRWAKR